MNQNSEKNLTALVTGGSRGIGRAVSVRLAQTCAKTVIVNYVQNDEAAEKTLGSIEKTGAKCVLARANLAYPVEIESLFEKIRSVIDRLDVIIHCAALGSFKPLVNIKPNQWDLSMNVNTRSFLLCVQRAIPLMRNGKIIAISSLGSQRALPNYGAIGASKAALESIIRQLAAELAPEGIQVNGVSGGFIETESILQFPGGQKFLESMRSRTPAGRLGKPDDIADVIMFLISPAARWIYGQVIVADGGISLL